MVVATSFEATQGVGRCRTPRLGEVAGDSLHPPIPVVSPHATSRGAADAASIGAAARVLPPRRSAALCGTGAGALVLRRRLLRGSAPASAMAVWFPIER